MAEELSREERRAEKDAFLISDEGATAVEEWEWRGMLEPVQTLSMWSAPDGGFIVLEEDKLAHLVEEIYCSTPTSTDVDSHCFTTVGRLRIVDRVAYIDLG
jgi:hypothetical protein